MIALTNTKTPLPDTTATAITPPTLTATTTTTTTTTTTIDHRLLYAAIWEGFLFQGYFHMHRFRHRKFRMFQENSYLYLEKYAKSDEQEEILFQEMLSLYQQSCVVEKNQSLSLSSSSSTSSSSSSSMSPTDTSAVTDTNITSSVIYLFSKDQMTKYLSYVHRQHLKTGNILKTVCLLLKYMLLIYISM
jgi:hypothetical protein